MRDFETWIKSVEDRLKNHDRRIKSSGPRLADTDWITPTLLNGWGPYAGTPATGWGTLQYRRFGGVTYIRGLLAIGASTTAAVAVLQAGFRPGKDMILSVRTAGGEARMEVLANGTISFPEGVPNPAYVSCACAPFIAEQ